jgi:hypothetical protein
MLLKSFLKGIPIDIEGAEMLLIASSQFLASPVGRELTSNGDKPKIGGTQTVVWWYEKI